MKLTRARVKELYDAAPTIPEGWRDFADAIEAEVLRLNGIGDGAAWWVVVDEQGLPEFITIDRQMAQDHINDAIQEHDYLEASKWVVRPVYTSQPQQEHSGSFMTREAAIEFLQRRRPGKTPTEQHISATIDAYSALFGDLSPVAPQQEQAAPYACNVCGNTPDRDGWLTHGKGCYTQSENGGGTEFVEQAAPSDILDEWTEEELRLLESKGWEQYICKVCGSSSGARRKQAAPVVVSQGWPLIRLGHGAVEVASGNHEGIPALIFGKNGTGKIGEATKPNRTLEEGETLACITFGNVESLEIVQHHINQVRAMLSSAPAPVQGEPMFYVRLLHDGLYEGPVHHTSQRINDGNCWTPLYTPLSAPAPVQGWMPIESAPKDGTAFRAYAEYLVDPDFNPEGSVECAWNGEEFIGCVWNGCQDAWYGKKIEPTHYQPLPPAPQEKQG